ncbi:type II toxin-antitoxin system VapC family toxin [Candidatus Woesearchaeota archaeon]|nr:type II toxin-antitoxin system VapC family toxin [Candidatus Woesearchaeota archaeon]
MFIDSNIFLEIALKNANYTKCEEFLKNLLVKNTPFYTSDFVIYSCLLIINSKLNFPVYMKNFLIFISSIKVSILRPSLKEIYSATNFMEKYKLDFDDALILSCMVENKIKYLVSYDKHFDKVKEVNVIKP